MLVSWRSVLSTLIASGWKNTMVTPLVSKTLGWMVASLASASDTQYKRKGVQRFTDDISTMEKVSEYLLKNSLCKIRLPEDISKRP